MPYAPDISFRLRNFRAFKDSGLQELRPLTFLVGENSAGKSSLLAGLNYLLRFRQGVQKSSFNAPPFELGGFDQVVFSRKGVSRPDSFEFEVHAAVDLNEPSLAFQFFRMEQAPPDIKKVRARLLFTSYHGEPRVEVVTIYVDDITLRADFSGPPVITITKGSEVIYPTEGEQERLPMVFSGSEFQRADPQVLSYVLSHTLTVATGYQRGARQHPRTRAIERAIAAAQGFSNALPYQTVTSAPTRSSPSRVYNPSDYAFQPDGSHTPYALNRLKNSDKKNWERIKSDIEAFGVDAGLFTKLHVSRYHMTDSSPFQIGVTVNGRQSNLIDVGYGVSQSLPILVDSLEANPATYFLLQQPEVHLHPQAQAALGSFFVDQVMTRDLGYLIETHSDFIINRVRIEVMSGRIPSQLVQILYLEKSRSTVKITKMSIDKNGNISGDPPGYRKFFLREGHKLLGARTGVHNSRQ